MISMDTESTDFANSSSGWLIKTKDFFKQWKGRYLAKNKRNSEPMLHQPINHDSASHLLASQETVKFCGLCNLCFSYNKTNTSIYGAMQAITNTERGSKNKNKVTMKNFEILKFLGKGGFGKVMLCKEKKTKTLLAMKIIKKEVILKMNEIGRIRTEGELLRRLKHPFIISLKYSFQTESNICFVMEFANGGDLQFHITKFGIFTEEATQFYGAEIVSAISYLHENDIMYRDLKLENLLMDREGHIKLTDFGLCKEYMAHGIRTKSICGTPQYMAPEIFEGEGYGRCVDWWAVGVIIYQMLCGEFPFNNRNTKVLVALIRTQQVPLPVELSDDACHLLFCILDKSPTRRLGARGAYEIKDHFFFETIDWVDLEQKKIPVPYIPELNSKDDTKYFNKTSASISITITSRDLNSSLKASEEDPFADFSFLDI